MKVLVAEDDLVTQRLLQHLIPQWGHDIVLANDGLEAVAIMQGESPPELVVLDWEMPGKDGVQVCLEIRSMEFENQPYIIFLTSKSGVEELVIALDAGASDFICKPYKPEELKARLNVGERTLRLQTDLLEARREMERLAMNDPLTGVYNRRAMWDLLERESSRARRDGRPITLGIFDIDHFKQVNDTYGHDVGDAVLVAFANVVKDTIRTTDVLARWGGEEFLILAQEPLESPGEGPMNPVFERVRSATEAIAVPTESGVVRVTVSGGVSIADGNEPIESIIKAADEALYEAKKSGRNRICANVGEKV